MSHKNGGVSGANCVTFETAHSYTKEIQIINL